MPDVLICKKRAKSLFLLRNDHSKDQAQRPDVGKTHQDAGAITKKLVTKEENPLFESV